MRRLYLHRSCAFAKSNMSTKWRIHEIHIYVILEVHDTNISGIINIIVIKREYICISNKEHLSSKFMCICRTYPKYIDVHVHTV